MGGSYGKYNASVGVDTDLNKPTKYGYDVQDLVNFTNGNIVCRKTDLDDEQHPKVLFKLRQWVDKRRRWKVDESKDNGETWRTKKTLMEEKKMIPLRPVFS